MVVMGALFIGTIFLYITIFNQLTVQIIQTWNFIFTPLTQTPGYDQKGNYFQSINSKDSGLPQTFSTGF